MVNSCDKIPKSHSLEIVLNRSKTASKISVIFENFKVSKILNCGQFVSARPRRECVARCMGHTLCSSAVKLATQSKSKQSCWHANKSGQNKTFSLAKKQDFEIHHFIFGAVFLLFAFGAIGSSHCTLVLKYTTSGT